MVGNQISCLRDLQQGDVIDLSWIPAMGDGVPTKQCTPSGVAVISQTCDIVQTSQYKTHITVAPILHAPSDADLSIARQGSSPLRVYLPPFGESVAAIIDLQYAVSIPKTAVVGTTLLARHAGDASQLSARNLAERVGRAYSRFAFPDEVVTTLSKLTKKARKAAQGQGGFGRVLEHLDFRVRANDWNQPGRILDFFVVVNSFLLIDPEDQDPDWGWETAKIVGQKPREIVSTANLTRLSELLADTCEAYFNDQSLSDGTTLLNLWELWVERLQYEILDPQVDSEVREFRVELVGDDEFPVSRWRQTVSLDLEDLSNSTLASDT